MVRAVMKEPLNWEDDEAFVAERADHLSLQTIATSTAIDGPTSNIVAKLLENGTKLLVGPRGCGKTHLMRYAFVKSAMEKNAPFCVYISFNRSYRLEPLLRNRTNALDVFHRWVICLCYLGLHDAVDKYCERLAADDTAQLNEEIWVDYKRDELTNIISRFEHGGVLAEEQRGIYDELSVDRLKENVIAVAESFSRSRSVLLLDDAALTLTPEYLPEFFDVVRVLRASEIAPKVSVYPGTTEYGSRFHAMHESEPVDAWFSVEGAQYSELMDSIGAKRFPGYADVDADVRELLKYAAFGVPRAYLTLLREFKKGGSRAQQNVNIILENFIKLKEAEYTSLAEKVPKFATLIQVGLVLFRKICDEITKESQSILKSEDDLEFEEVRKEPIPERQLYIGIEDSVDRNAHTERMLSLLVEAGLLFRYASVSHGKERTYDRYMPHLAALIRERAFSEKRGFSTKAVVEVIQRPQRKHPVRRTLSTLIGSAAIQGLKLDLPPCQACGTPRLTEKSKFCDNCGELLMDSSKFKRCMDLRLVDVPGLTDWQRTKLAAELPDVKTVGDFVALSDPGSKLRKMYRIGAKRATKITELVNSFVDDFLS